MIADDSGTMRGMIRDLLQSTDVLFIEACSGIEAVEKYRRSAVDWVLMDVMMESMNGISAARKIRAMDPTAKIIMVSQYDDPDLRAAAAEAGSVGYVVKDNLSQLTDWIPRKSL